MHLLKKIFGSAKSNQSNMNQVTNTPGFPEKNLFIDSTPPQGKDAKSNTDNAVRHFLNQDHHSAGLIAGYNMHCHDGLILHLKGLRSCFREAIDSFLAGIKKEISEKEILLAQLGDMLPSQKLSLEICLKQIQGIMEEATLQKALSIDDEGWVGTAINSFEMGFRRGLLDYMNENDFLKQTSL